MKQLLLFFTLFISLQGYSQKKLFYTYSDSKSIEQDANDVVTDFVNRVNAVYPTMDGEPPVARINTQPYLIFYLSETNEIGMPFWKEVMPQQKKFFAELAGGDEEGKKMFGYFFNGFYLAHELGHALRFYTHLPKLDNYENEYFANVIGMLYWRKTGRKKELKKCYKLAKQIVAKLPSPVPAGEDPIKYFNEHYHELGPDPYKYGFFQMAQFVKVYEDKSLKDFDSFLKDLKSQERSE